jgi:cytoskeletal protein CcmA (bactofilin family)
MIRAKSVFLASTARMAGDVEHESLAIEPGAYIEGHCKRITETAVGGTMDVHRPSPAPRVASIGKAAIAGA